MCSIHGKMRIISCLMDDGQGGFHCVPGQECLNKGDKKRPLSRPAPDLRARKETAAPLWLNPRLYRALSGEVISTLEELPAPEREHMVLRLEAAMSLTPSEKWSEVFWNMHYSLPSQSHAVGR